MLNGKNNQHQNWLSHYHYPKGAFIKGRGNDDLLHIAAALPFYVSLCLL